MKLFFINIIMLAINPQSGDTSNINFPIVIAVVTLVAIVINIVLKKPKTDEKINEDDKQEK